MASHRSDQPGTCPEVASDDRLAPVLPFPSLGNRAAEHEQETDGAPARLRIVIGEVLREERLDQGRTLADVADDAAISLPYLSEVERGRKEISSDLLDAVCGALELPLVGVLERCVERLRAGAQGGPRVQLLAA